MRRSGRGENVRTPPDQQEPELRPSELCPSGYGRQGKKYKSTEGIRGYQTSVADVEVPEGAQLVARPSEQPAVQHLMNIVKVLLAYTTGAIGCCRCAAIAA